MSPTLIVIGIAILGAVLAMWGAMRASEAKGRAKEREQQAKDALDAVDQHRKVENSVNALPADDVRKRLQQWSRD